MRAAPVWCAGRKWSPNSGARWRRRTVTRTVMVRGKPVLFYVKGSPHARGPRQLRLDEAQAVADRVVDLHDLTPVLLDNHGTRMAVFFVIEFSVQRGDVV